MNRILFIVSLFFVSINLLAQDGTWSFNTPYDEAYVYSLVANVRDGETAHCNVIDKLNCGHDVKIVAKGTEAYHTLNGVSAYWAQIEYKKDGDTKQGYIWAANLTPSRLKRGTTKFLYGVESYSKSDEYGTLNLGVRIVENGKIVAQQVIPNTCHNSTIYAELTDSRGLHNVKNILTIASAGEACGVYTCEYHFAWTGTELVGLPGTIGMGDGGIAYESSELFFPNNGIPHGTVVKVYSEGYSSDDMLLEDNRVVYEKERFKTEVYKWTGDAFHLQLYKWIPDFDQVVSGYEEFFLDSSRGEAYIYSLVANVRDSAGTDSNVIDKLKAGEVVVIEDIANMDYTLKGLRSYWLKISYTKDGNEKEGYIWGGNLSGSQIRRQTTKYLYGVESTSKDGLIMGVRIVTNGEVVAQQTFPIGTSHSIAAELIGNKGLYGVKEVLKVSTEASCDSEDSNYNYFAWTGKEIIPLTNCIVIPDEDASYQQSKLLFPSDGAPYDTIFKIYEEGNGGAVRDEYQDFAIEKYKIKVYKWTHRGLEEQNQNWNSRDEW